MLTQQLIGLLGFAFVSSITPGPNNMMLMASGANYGLRRTMPHMLGVAIGFALMIFLVGVGLIGVFEAWPPAFTVLKVVSAAYLLWLAWKIATAPPPRRNRHRVGRGRRLARSPPKRRRGADPPLGRRNGYATRGPPGRLAAIDSLRYSARWAGSRRGCAALRTSGRRQSSECPICLPHRPRRFRRFCAITIATSTRLP